MSSSTSVFRRRLKGALILLLGITAFMVFDRGFSALLELAEKEFYSTEENGGIITPPGIHYNTLIMGTSRAREGILPIHLHRFLKLRAFSTAGIGCYPRYHYLAYLRFREQNGPPRFLFYGLDYFTFDKKTGPKHLAAMGVKADESVQESLSVKGLARVSLLARNKPRFDQMLVDMVNSLAAQVEGEHKDGIPPVGISPYTGLYGKVPRHLREEPPTWRPAPFTPFPGKEGDYLFKLLELARKDKVYVFLVYLPDYINVYRTNHMQKEFRDQMEKLAARFPRVHFLDFNQPQRFPLADPELFVDGGYGTRISHLSALGARRFNRMLAFEVRRRLQKTPKIGH